MPHDIEQRLKEIGIVLPEPAVPVASYVPFAVSGNTLYISGQLPVKNGEMVKGLLGREVDIEHGQQAAALCAINILSQAKAAVGGDWSRLKRLLRLGGFVACTPDFTDHPKVINGASDLMVAALGDAGKHARAAVGVASLPFGVAVEVDAIFEIA